MENISSACQFYHAFGENNDRISRFQVSENFIIEMGTMNNDNNVNTDIVNDLGK